MDRSAPEISSRCPKVHRLGTTVLNHTCGYYQQYILFWYLQKNLYTFSCRSFSVLIKTYCFIHA